MLQDQFTSVLKVGSPAELLAELVTFARWLGFETVSATAVVDHFRGEAAFIGVDNTPIAYQEAFDDPSNWTRDPVCQYCKRANVPIVWNQGTYTSSGQGEKWEEQAGYGYCTGIALALHLPQGRHFFIGVDRDKPLPTAPAEITRMVADLQLFAVYAQDAALRALLPASPQSDNLLLTSRELESLRWTMEGKTAWELGNILGISEQTAARHVNNAAHKLGCVNKHQAVLKALRAGLIR